MVRYNEAIISSLFGSSKNKAITNTEATADVADSSVSIIEGIALADSVDGEVLVQIGDPIKALLYEEDEEGDEVDFENDSVDDDDVDETEEDEEEESLEEPIYGGDDFIGEDEGESIADNVDSEGNTIEAVIE